MGYAMASLRIKDSVEPDGASQSLPIDGCADCSGPAKQTSPQLTNRGAVSHTVASAGSCFAVSLVYENEPRNSQPSQSRGF